MAQPSKQHVLPKGYTSGSLVDGEHPGNLSAFGGTPSYRSGPSPSPSNIDQVAPATPLPPPRGLTPRPLNERESQLVSYLGRLQFFLATAPTQWAQDSNLNLTTSSLQPGSVSSPDPNLNRFLLPNGEYVSCIYWNKLFHITGTDIVRALVFRFEAFSRPVRNVKKFEEGVFSDLRNLKPGSDACLEEPKSPFLDLLFRNGCIRTQKKVAKGDYCAQYIDYPLTKPTKQVFYWFSVPHDRLFLDALERDLKREKMGLEPTTAIEGEPARSFRYDPTRGLFEQFAGDQHNPSVNQDNVPSAANHPSVTPSPYGMSQGPDSFPAQAIAMGYEDNIRAYDSPMAHHESVDHSPRSDEDGQDHSQPDTANSVLFSKTLFVGSPAYKQRRKRSRKRSRRAGTATTGYDTEGSGSESDVMQQALPVSTFPDWPTQPLGPGVRSTSAYHGHLSTQRLDQPPMMSHQQLGTAVPLTNGSPLMMSSVSRGQEFHSDEFAHTSTPSASILRTSKEAIAISSASSTPGKGFTCPLIPCARVFKRLEHLKRHVRTHTHERPFGCDRCPKRFSRSDNLTQHHKTHEKADRGERMKTELSETAADDHYSDAEVDAMSRGQRTWTEFSQPGLAPRLRHSTHDGTTTGYGIQPSRYHPYNARPEDHMPPIPQHVAYGDAMWASPLPAYAGAPHLAPNLGSRRYRSMTPHPPNVPNFTADHWLGDQSRAARPFPQAVGAMFGTPFADESYHRATSLDPSTLNMRASPLLSQVPTSFNRLSGDGQMGQFSASGQSVIGSDMNRIEPANAVELKTTLADEYTNSNWEQHNT